MLFGRHWFHLHPHPRTAPFSAQFPTLHGYMNAHAASALSDRRINITNKNTFSTHM
ncbi:hypothetical protein B0F90DRAFT_1712744 [Multifurca ochricompacta]|uniref:Uncharacterized protein n=1 Tax=Multifurca ochricompacta TaxID=376703 RepID=A0AAD4M6Y6_9AGAM|nr:hypothetical protein B0F90DRAFT_1712744 [Multifurca ochricompacta]